MAKLKTWHEKHKNRHHKRVRMLVVECPEYQKICGVENVCIHAHVNDDRCKHFGSLGFGYIICNHPKAGGDGDGA